MSRIIERNAKGEVVLPADIVDAVTPHDRFEVDVRGNQIVARPVEGEEPLWKRLTPEERAREFREWVRNLSPKAPHLPDEALRRESVYD
jgi:hypothetical protein